ncbi:ethanolamine utilization protein EutH [Clostridium sp.]|uniref:ethanolamine utilization protein EutH n=1 Tax=Clostridium sp. TaxID=1506 RepID=UPI003F3150A4
MEKIVLYIVGAFFVIGIFDYILGNKLKLGTYFEDGIKNIGSLALSMVGILSITPILSDLIVKYIVPITNKIGIDSSIISSSFIAIDMGAYKIAEGTASSSGLVYFSGVLIASILGCTISFTLPLALGVVDKKYHKLLCKGILCGIVTIPVGLFVGGLLLGLSAKLVFMNLLPIIILAIFIAIGLTLCPDKVVKGFTYIGNVIVIISLIGLGIQGFTSITGIVISNRLMPLEEALSIVGKISIFLGGAYVMLEIVKKVLANYLDKIKDKIGINSTSIAALIGSLASAIVVFSTFEELDDRGKVVCSAFSVAGAYVLGGQLGYVATEAREVVLIYIFVKLFCGILAIILSLIVTRDNKDIKLS